MKKVDSEEVAVVVVIEGAFSIEVIIEEESHKLPMVIVNLTIRRREKIIKIRKKQKEMIKSKEIEEVMADTKKLMKTLITISISMALDLNTKKLMSLLKLKYLVSQPKIKGKSSQINRNLIRK